MVPRSIGDRYILGSEDMTLQEILTAIATTINTKPPSIKLPHNLVLPIAWCMERVASITGTPPRVTVAGVQLAKKRMFFSHAKASTQLDYSPRPSEHALSDAISWFQGFTNS